MSKSNFSFPISLSPHANSHSIVLILLSFLFLVITGGFSPKETIYDEVSSSAKLPPSVSSHPNEFIEKTVEGELFYLYFLEIFEIFRNNFEKIYDDILSIA